MRALITGVTGFVGGYLVKELQKENFEIFGLGTRTQLNINGVEYSCLNLLDRESLFRYIKAIKPDVVFHLGGISNVKYSWEQKLDTFSVNVMGTINLLDAIKEHASQTRVLTIGSAEEYGPKSPKSIPIMEDEPLEPISPYGISKVTISMLVKQYVRAYDISIIHARPFNHIGPGQSKGFVVPDFVTQIIKIETNNRENVMHVGNLSARRDFTDVRDIVRAYVLLAKYGSVGEVYNVCSNQGIAIENILYELIALSKLEIKVEVDESLLRPIDIPIYIGSNQKIRQDTGWEPIIPLSTTLSDVLEHFRNIAGSSL